MSTLYWITVLGTLNKVCLFLSMFLGLILLLGICCIIYEPDKNIKKGIKFIGWLLIPCVLGAIFIPSKKDLYVIYGVGTTLDYLKDNPKAKQLPDKCIEAFDKYLDTVNTENKK